MRFSNKRVEIDWDRAWNSLITFFEALIGEPEFWAEQIPKQTGLVPTRDWIASAVAEFLRAGTRNDERAYSTALLPRTWVLVQILLNASNGVDEPSDDAMSQAINSTKGKAVEALFDHALRACRVSDSESGSHTGTWNAMVGVFDNELAKCRNGNYEYSTLVGAYLPQLNYMDSTWAQLRAAQIFPADFTSNSICAIDGLAYPILRNC